MRHQSPWEGYTIGMEPEIQEQALDFYNLKKEDLEHNQVEELRPDMEQ